MTNTTLRLITSEVVEGEENTIVLHGLYFDGYDTKLKFNYDDLLEPSIEMEEHVCGSTAELFDTTHGNGKLMMTQRRAIPPTSARARSSCSTTSTSGWTTRTAHWWAWWILPPTSSNG